MSKKKLVLLGSALVLWALFPSRPAWGEAAPAKRESFVAVMEMRMMILPGTLAYLESTMAQAHAEGAKILIVKLDTPGGILETAQQMIQAIFKSPIPVVIYVSPTGATAASAGVFITLAGHIAAMAPGTSIGAAHPVSGTGQNLESDMRTKAQNITVAMVKAIADRRGRNVTWAEQSVKESSSVTEKEALKLGVIDVTAEDIDGLLKQLKGREIRLEAAKVVLDDYSSLPRRYYEISYRQKFLNVLANPNVAALLWLAATTGISLELYNPGAILPGVVGVICLILALAVSHIIPLSQGAVLLIIIGALLIGAELVTGSLVLGIGGLIAMVLGAIYLVDVSRAPGMSVAVEFVIPTAVFLGGLLLFVTTRAVKVLRREPTTGDAGIVGQRGKAVETVAKEGRVFVNGEYWNAFARQGVIEKDAAIRVVGLKEGLILEVEKVE